jgi:hypothetical protein
MTEAHIYGPRLDVLLSGGELVVGIELTGLVNGVYSAATSFHAGTVKVGAPFAALGPDGSSRADGLDEVCLHERLENTAAKLHFFTSHGADLKLAEVAAVEVYVDVVGARIAGSGDVCICNLSLGLYKPAVFENELPAALERETETPVVEVTRRALTEVINAPQWLLRALTLPTASRYQHRIESQGSIVHHITGNAPGGRTCANLKG